MSWVCWELKPNNKQETLFRQHCGVTRHNYNFGSKNRAKAIFELAKTQANVSSIRRDATHKLTYTS
ncbi:MULTISPECIES: helix-turn-helix domain-containing protein [Cylindrospermopsis]|uniref:helix-turn-helix domain-containing protein n=1 Tax=Cylindrospermopsis TaxID=77021 RepID=UPI00092F8EF2|nr:helix-turn-helix domain-containing protein [Cylindrospermopsis raciborskii Cr2010]